MKMAADFTALSYAPERSDSTISVKAPTKDQAERIEDAFVHNGIYGVSAAWVAVYAIIIAAGLLKSILG